MNDLPREILDFILRTLRYQLHSWDKAGMLTPRQWFTLILLVCFGVAWFLFQNTAPVMMPSAVAQQMPTATITPTTTVTPTPTPTIQATPTPVVTLPPVVARVIPTAQARQPTPTATATPIPQPIYQFHMVGIDETLLTIAAQYHISSETLLAVNGIRHPEALETGRLLAIPPTEERTQRIVPHYIQAADNLLSVASRYNSSVSAIYEANPHLFTGAHIPEDELLAVPVVFEQEMYRPEETTYYTIQEGDTPLRIAGRFDIPLEVLLMLNGIEEPHRLQIGDILRIPPAEDVSLGFPVILHELTEHDTLLGLSITYGSSVKDILSVNPDLVPSQLTPGELVAVPVIFIPDAPRDDLATPTPVPVSGPIVTEQLKMLLYVNAERTAEGLPRLEGDPELSAVAVAHAQNMVSRGFFAHVTPEGLTLRDRVRAGGVTSFIRVGENIQRNTQPRTETAKAASDWFMGSPPHRGNMLHPKHNRLGVGIVEGPPGWFTIVLVFGER